MGRIRTTARLLPLMNRVWHFLRFLQEKGSYQNTVIVLCGAHGESLGEHGRKDARILYLQQRPMHVPLIIIRSRRMPRQRVGCRYRVSPRHRMPTCAGCGLGLELPFAVQGHLLSRLRARSKSPQPHP